MKTAIRFDQGSLRKPERTAQGFLKVDALVARVGVLEYRNKDGSIRRELRLPEDVFRADSLAAFEGVSITDGHPTVLVDANNVRTLESGTVTGTARRDGDWVVAPMVIKDPKLIAKIESGKTGVSAGYTIREDWTPGVHPVYGAYDLIQRDIGPNHIAGAVEVPRAGDGARVRMDCGMDVAVEVVVMTTATDGHQHTLSPTESAGSTSHATAEGAEDSHRHEWIRKADGSIEIAENAGHTHAVDNSTIGTRTDSQIDRSRVVPQPGVNMKLEEQVKLLQTQLAEATARASTAEADLKTRTDERDTEKARAETAEGIVKEKQARLDAGSAAAEGEAVKEKQTRIDELERELSDMRKDFPVKVRARAQLVMRAQAVLGDNVRADAMDDRTILEEGVRRFEPTIKIDKSTSDAYLKARFDSLYESRAASASSLKRASADLAIRTDAVREPDPFDPLNNGVGQWASPHATAKKGA